MSLPARQSVAELPLEFRDEHESLRIVGFWLFLASDVVLFATLFTVYVVYQSRVAAGPTPFQLITYGPAVKETLLLLTSSFTCGLATYQMRRGSRRGVVLWLVVTILLGIAFVTTEAGEFATDLASGATWNHSAFLSGFYTLVGTHGFHVSFGILWAVVLVLQLAFRGLNKKTARKFYTFSLYWHFLDIIWVFIFTVVYLGGKIG